MTWEERLSAMSLAQLEDAAFRLDLHVQGRRTRKGYAAAIQRDVCAEPLHLARAISYAHVCNLIEYFSRRQPRRNPRRSIQPQLELTFASLIDFGLAWRDAHYWYLDPCAKLVCSLSPEEMEILRVEEEIIEETEGWLRLYGVLPVAEAAQRVADVGQEEVFQYWSRFFGRSGFRESGGQIWLAHPTLENPEWLLMALAAEQTEDIPYAAFTDADRLSASTTGLPEQGRALEFCRSLYQRELVESGILFIPMVMLQKGAMQEANAFLRTLPRQKERPPTVEQALIGRCLDQFPRWKFKGHSAADMQKYRPTRQEQPSAHRLYH